MIIENVGRRSETWSEKGAPTDVGERSLNGFERNVLFWNQGDGRFHDVGYLTGGNLIEDGRGVAVADFDHDGRQDVVIQNMGKPASLLMGRGEAGHWLQVELEGTASNRDAIGAIVIVTVGSARQMRQVAVGSGFLASSSPVLHFGLGAATAVDSLEIRWPAGGRETHHGIGANQRIKFREAAPAGA